VDSKRIAPGEPRSRRPFRRWAPLALIAAAMAVGVVGCGGDDGETSASGEGIPEGDIVIGAVIAKTGIMAPYDEGIAAIRLEIDKINKSGGIHGHKLRMIESDTRSDPQHAALAAQSVVDKGADVLLVPCDADSAAPASLLAQDKGKLNFTVCAGEPKFGPPTTGQNSFGAITSLMAEVGSSAGYMKEQGWERPFLFRDTQLSYGRDMCDGFEIAWEERGGSIAGKADFHNEDSSLSGQIGKLNAADADSVVMCSYPPGGATAIKQIRGAGVDVPIVAAYAFDGTAWLESVPDLSDFYYTNVGSIFGDDPRPEVNEFFADLRERDIQLEQAASWIGGVSAIQAIADAIEEANTVDGGKLVAQLETWEDHPLLIGPTTFTKDVHVPTRPVVLMQITDGKTKFVETLEPGAVPEVKAGG